MTQDDSSSVEKPKLAYSLEEAAEATGYSTSTLRIAIRRHDLLARYANTKAVILADELQDWLKSLPTEPRGGHRPLSYLVEDGAKPAPFPGPRQLSPRTPAIKALFRTPEDVAPDMGIKKSSLRSYCRASGIYTKVGNRIMLHEDDIQRLVAWIREEQAKAGEWSKEPEHDPFK